MSSILFELFLTDADLLDLLEERKIFVDLVYELPKILFDLFRLEPFAPRDFVPNCRPAVAFDQVRSAFRKLAAVQNQGNVAGNDNVGHAGVHGGRPAALQHGYRRTLCFENLFEILCNAFQNSGEVGCAMVPHLTTQFL